VHHNNLEVVLIDATTRENENHIRWLGHMQWRLITAPLRIIAD